MSRPVYVTDRKVGRVERKVVLILPLCALSRAPNSLRLPLPACIVVGSVDEFKRGSLKGCQFVLQFDGGGGASYFRV